MVTDNDQTLKYQNEFYNNDVFPHNPVWIYKYDLIGIFLLKNSVYSSNRLRRLRNQLVSQSHDHGNSDGDHKHLWQLGDAV